MAQTRAHVTSAWAVENRQVRANLMMSNNARRQYLLDPCDPYPSLAPSELQGAGTNIISCMPYERSRHVSAGRVGAVVLRASCRYQLHPALQRAGAGGRVGPRERRPKRAGRPARNDRDLQRVHLVGRLDAVVGGHAVSTRVGAAPSCCCCGPCLGSSDTPLTISSRSTRTSGWPRGIS